MARIRRLDLLERQRPRPLDRDMTRPLSLAAAPARDRVRADRIRAKSGGVYVKTRPWTRLAFRIIGSRSLASVEL